MDNWKDSKDKIDCVQNKSYLSVLYARLSVVHCQLSIVNYHLLHYPPAGGMPVGMIQLALESVFHMHESHQIQSVVCGGESDPGGRGEQPLSSRAFKGVGGEPSSL